MRQSVSRLMPKVACARLATFAGGFVILVTAITGSLPLVAQSTYTWNGGNGNWSNLLNWSPLGIPNCNCNVDIDGGKTISSTVTLNMDASIQNLTIDSNDALSFAPGHSLTISGTPRATLAINGSMSMNGGGDQLRIGTAVSLTGAGALTMGGDGNNTILAVSSNDSLNNQITINGAGSISVNLSNSGVINANTNNAIDISPPNSLVNVGTLESTNYGALTLNNFFSTTTNYGTIQATAGTVVLDGGVINNFGTVQVLGYGFGSTVVLDNLVINNSSGSIQAIDIGFGATVSLEAGVVINGGTLSSTGHGFIEAKPGSPATLNGVTLSGSYSVDPGGGLILQGANNSSASLIDQGNITNSGVFSNIGGAVDIFPGVSFVGVTSGSKGQRTDSYVQSGSSSSTFLSSSTSALSSLTGVWINGGTLYGEGTITAPWLHVTQGGTVNGLTGTPNLLTIKGGYMQSGGSTPGVLHIYLYNDKPIQNDELVVDGTAWLHGELDVTMGLPFILYVGDRFTIMTYDLRKGRFDTVDLPTLPFGEKWSVAYTPRSLVLTVVGLPPVGSPEFSSAAAAAPVPQPSSICLLAGGLSILGSRARKRIRLKS